jgi:hypothetical protein
VPPSLGQYSQRHTLAWSETIAAFDGYVFVTPEYNHLRARSAARGVRQRDARSARRLGRCAKDAAPASRGGPAVAASPNGLPVRRVPFGPARVS